MTPCLTPPHRLGRASLRPYLKSIRFDVRRPDELSLCRVLRLDVVAARYVSAASCPALRLLARWEGQLRRRPGVGRRHRRGVSGHPDRRTGESWLSAASRDLPDQRGRRPTVPRYRYWSA